MNMPDGKNQPSAVRPPAKPAEQVGLRVSLIPEQEEKIKDPRAGFGKFILTSVIGVLILGAIVGYLRFSVYAAGQEIKKIDARTAAIGEQSFSSAASLKDAKLSQTRLAALAVLLSEHRSGVRVFDFFEKHTLSDVAFSSIAIGENSTVNLSASAGSFESYAAQINELNAQPLVKGVVSSGLSPIYDGENKLQQVDFALSITFDPAIFTNSPAKD